jgi:hypothetical protein
MLTRARTGEYVGKFAGLDVTLPKDIDLAMDDNTHVANNVALDDDIVRAVQNVAYCSISNYLAIRRKESALNRKHSNPGRILVFINKQSKRPGQNAFTRCDEALGHLAMQISAIIETLHQAVIQSERERALKAQTYLSAAEMLSNVFL